MSEDLNEVRYIGELAITMATTAERCIGPDGTLIKVSEENAGLLRALLITNLAEAACERLDVRKG